MKNCFLFDGQIYSKNSFEVNFYDRGFAYSDGFFETIYFDGEKPTHLERHKERIKEGFEKYEFNFLADFINSIGKNIVDLNQQLDSGEKLFKLILWRKEGGLFIPTENDFHYLLFARPKTSLFETKIQHFDFIKIDGFVKNHFSGVKNLSCNLYVKAGIEAKKKNLDDCIILNHFDHMTECLYGNLFWETENQLFTPALETGCINGIIRRKIFANIPVQEGLFMKETLHKADLIFSTNVGGIKIYTKSTDTNLNQNSKLIQKIEELYKN